VRILDLVEAATVILQSFEVPGVSMNASLQKLFMEVAHMPPA
jgi:hypothetical protein